MIKTEIRERIATIELARLDKKNALTAAMYAAMTDSLATAESDSGVRAIVIHGTRDCFTAGNDLKDFLEGPAGASAGAALCLGAVESLQARGRRGRRAGGGNRHHSASALRSGVRGAGRPLPAAVRAARPGARGGFEPAAAEGRGLPARRRVAALGQAFTASEALAAGIVTEIVPEETLIERARAGGSRARCAAARVRALDQAIDEAAGRGGRRKADGRGSTPVRRTAAVGGSEGSDGRVHRKAANPTSRGSSEDAVVSRGILAFALACSTLCPSSASCDPYPSRPVRVIVPFGAGVPISSQG